MTKIGTFLAFIVLISLNSFSQVCVIDYSVSGTGIYPDTMPTGTVGQPYSTDVTFFMPLDTLGYDFTNFQIQSVSLPVGLSWDCSNNTNGCNYNPQTSQYGCVVIYGTPLLAGIYNIDVQVIADLTVISGYPFTFQIYMEVLPYETVISNDGFTMSNATGCNPLTVNFTNNNPGLLEYNWDFGNGNTSSLENPGPQLYTTPGEYIVQYEAYDNVTPINVYTLTGVDITSMSNFGGNFPTFETADPYFILKENGTTIYQSAFYLDQDPPVSWATNILLDPLNTYVFEIWEADETAGEVYFFGDDAMGQHTLNLVGCNGCSAGTSTINYQISLQTINPTPFVVSIDTIEVFDFPAVPVIGYDNTTFSIATPDLGLSYQWYLDGVAIPGATSSEFDVTETGNYSVLAINGASCTAESEELYVLYCDPAIDPVISPAVGFLFVTGFPAEYEITWFLNGTPIAGQVNDTLNITQAGDYTVSVVSDLGCEFTSTVFGTNLGMQDASIIHWNLYPNPADNQLFIEINNDQKLDAIQLLDLSGRVVNQWTDIEGTKLNMNIEEIPAGYFIVKLISGSQSWSKNLIIQ